ncbi:hypothetical protein FACS1894187_13440 [Synergistales bacterium]|nr:hypothetical protein FACS1894187_13440 [Synergistales bacterium]
MAEIEIFQEEFPSLESYWRSIILFGQNVASYKFALAKSLLEIAPLGKNALTLEDLSEPFSRHLCEHIKNFPKQVTSGSSKFLDTCKAFNDGEISKDRLLAATSQMGFNNVIDAFHVVNKKDIPMRFYQKDYGRRNKKIVLTDNIFKLQTMKYFDDFTNETESRWNLVETAWELGISRNLLDVQYNEKDKILFVNDDFRRKTITSARDALNGYQKGKCFYCFDDITVNGSENLICDIDHFFPHTLQPMMKYINIDGVWNLVLSCQNCNRGGGGKFARVPAVKYLTRLHKRNEFLIKSHHPLRETIMAQTGASQSERIAFLRATDKNAVGLLIHRWGTVNKGMEVF